MDEKTLDLNPGGTPPAENGQTANEPPVSGDLVDEIDRTLLEDVVPTADEDDTVVLSKRELEKLTMERDNYKRGLLSIKEKKTPKPATPKPVETGGNSNLPEWFTKVNEQKAIAAACSDPDVENNWPDVVRYYRDTRGRATVEAIASDIDDAVTLYKKNAKVKASEDDKEITAKVVSESKSQPASSGEGKKAEKKHIIQKKSDVSTWYK